MKKGFTLIEILAVVTIMGLIFILVIPKIGTSLKKDVDTTTNNLIITAAKNYVNDNQDTFDKIDNNIYCLPLTTLTKKDYLDSPVKNVTDDLDITNSKSVKITYNKGFKYEVVDKKECEVVNNPPCDYDYCDFDGDGYIKVEYLESTGTQYIDTGYKPNSKTSIEMDLEYLDALSLSSTPYVFIAGARNDVDSNTYIFAVNKNDYSLRFEYQTNTNYAVYENFKDKGVIKTKNNIIDYASIQKELNASDFSCDYNLYLFDANLGGTPSNRGTKIRLYKSKIYENNILVRDYVPVIDKKNKPCLYDTVNKKCYYNFGTEDFKYFGKSDKSDSYLESTGTQYIDTGYKPNSKTSIEMDLEYLDAVSPASTSPYVFIAGARNDVDSNAYIFAVNKNDYSLRFEYQTYTNYAVYEDFKDKGVIKTKNNIIEYDSIQKELNTSNLSCDYNLYLFDANLGGTPSNRGTKMRLYSVRIYEDNILVRDYVPNIDNNNELCLYDQIEKKCYYNQGTGEFLYGLIRSDI